MSAATRKALATGLVFGLMALFVPGTAAQERQFEISGGWSYAHQTDVSIPGGWYASGGRYLNEWFGLVGQASGHYKRMNESGVDVKTNFHIFGAGPRFAYRRYPRFTPFVDLLVGAGRASAGSAFGSTSNESVTNFAYKSNFGLAINNSSGLLGVRVAVGDYGVRSDAKWTNDSSFEAGVVIRR